MSNDRWKILCERINRIKRKKKDEDSLHDGLEAELEFTFKWPSEHIKHKPHAKKGSIDIYPDIVLEGDGFGIIIEVKAPGVKIGDEQLDSYMTFYRTQRDNIRCKYGFLISDGIKVYFAEDLEKGAELVASFGFDIESPDGNALSEILFYDNCSVEKLTKYMEAPHELKEPDADGDIKKKQTPLEKIVPITDILKAFNDDRTFEMGEPENLDRDNIGSKRGGKHNAIWFYITSNINGVQFSWQTKNEDLIQLEEKSSRVKEYYKNKDTDKNVRWVPGRSSPKWSRIWIDVNQEDPAKDCLEIAKTTKDLVGYYRN
jgi:hypothetical protein